MYLKSDLNDCFQFTLDLFITQHSPLPDDDFQALGIPQDGALLVVLPAGLLVLLHHLARKKKAFLSFTHDEQVYHVRYSDLQVTPQ